MACDQGCVYSKVISFGFGGALYNAFIYLWFCLDCMKILLHSLCRVRHREEEGNGSEYTSRLGKGQLEIFNVLQIICNMSDPKTINFDY